MTKRRSPQTKLQNYLDRAADYLLADLQVGWTGNFQVTFLDDGAPRRNSAAFTFATGTKDSSWLSAFEEFDAQHCTQTTAAFVRLEQEEACAVFILLKDGSGERAVAGFAFPSGASGEVAPANIRYVDFGDHYLGLQLPSCLQPTVTDVVIHVA